MKRYSVIGVLVVVLVALLGAALNTTAQGDVIRIAYLTKHLDNPWFVNEVGGARALAEQYGDVELTVQDLQFDAGLALSAMDTVIGAGIDGIIMVVPEQQIGPAVIQKAADAGIPFLTVDGEITDAQGNYAPHVGFDTRDMGIAVANKAFEIWKAEGWDTPEIRATTRIVSVEDQPLIVCMERTDSANATWLELVPDWPAENIIHLPYANTLVSAIDSMAPVVVANPDITHWILWSCNDDGVIGSIRALEQGRVQANNIIGVGLNGHLACDEWNKGVPTGFRATIYNRSASHGEFAMMAMYNTIKYGIPLPRSIVAPGIPVTPDQAGIMDYPSCQS